MEKIKVTFDIDAGLLKKIKVLANKDGYGSLSATLRVLLKKSIASPLAYSKTNQKTIGR